MNYIKKDKKRICVLILISLVLAFFCEQLLFGCLANHFSFFRVELSEKLILRVVILFIAIFFLGCHFLFPIKKMYLWLFDKRYWVALAVIIFLMINQYHGSSVGMFDQYIQPGEGSEFVESVFGTPRAIRSDEWVVSTPNRLSTQFGNDVYSKYSDIMRATKTPNLIAGNMYFNFAALANPFVFAIFIFGQTYGQSIVWYGPIILTFLVSIEMCMIISKGNKLISVMGAAIIVFSGFYQWWISISAVAWLLGAQAAIVCGYHFIQTNKTKYKILLAFALAISLAYFVTILYPAWQVPVAYLFLGILIWIIWDNKSKIFKFRLGDWSILFLAIFLALLIIVTYFWADMDYLKSIMNTVYPGSRISVGGKGNSKLFWWFYNPLFAVPGKQFLNPSEGGSFITFFPIPLFVALWYLIKEKKRDSFVIIMLIITIFLGTYIIFGWPELLAKITLMSYSTTERTTDIFAFTQVYLLIAVLARFDEASEKISKWLAISLIGLVLPLYIIFNIQKFPEVGLPIKYIVLVSILFCIFSIGIMTKVSTIAKRNIIIGITIFAFGTGIFVHPIQKGFDVLYSKPLSYKIQEIIENDPEAKWVSITNNIVTQQFLIANGAPTINSTNIMPNLDLWYKLDPSKQYNEVYNRYSHIIVELTEEDTHFELLGADLIKLYLSYGDIQKTDVTYIYAQEEIIGNELLDIEKIYDESGSYIYKIIK